MRTRNRVVAVVLAGILALASAACSGGKKKISAEEFREKMEDKSYVVTEAAASRTLVASYKDNPNLLTVTYSEFDSADAARMSYSITRHSYEQAKSTGNYTSILIGDKKFVAQKGVEMTVITVLVEDVVIMAYGSDKTMVQDAIEALGY